MNDPLLQFIAAKHFFFSGAAGPAGRVSVSPKGMGSPRVLAPDRIIWRNLTGSGNETAGQLVQIDPITLMWCCFTVTP